VGPTSAEQACAPERMLEAHSGAIPGDESLRAVSTHEPQRRGDRHRQANGPRREGRSEGRLRPDMRIAWPRPQGNGPMRPRDLVQTVASRRGSLHPRATLGRGRSAPSLNSPWTVEVFADHRNTPDARGQSSGAGIHWLHPCRLLTPHPQANHSDGCGPCVAGPGRQRHFSRPAFVHCRWRDNGPTAPGDRRPGPQTYLPAATQSAVDLHHC